MGEDKIIGFESLKQTMVFWNIDDYPTPSDDDLDPIFCDILKALHVMGFRRGFTKLILYSQHPNIDKQEIHCLPQGKFYNAVVFNVPDITMHLIRHASTYGPGPVNFFVIAKLQRELHRVLQCLKSRRHNVVLVKPPQHEEEFVFSLESLLENARLLGGGKPRFKELYPYYSLEYDMFEEEYVEIKEADVSKTVDFSERIPTVKGVRTAVFWDAEDCPFPLGSTPDENYHSIVSALVERYYNDEITIWVYLDDDKKGSWRDVLLGPKTWASRIYFLPGGDKAERRVRMLNDIYLWKRDSPQLIRRYEASLVLVSDQFKDFAYYTEWLQRLYEMHYDLLLVTPTLDINRPESPLWPGLLIGKGGYLYGFEASQISQQPCPKKHEAEETPP